ncbi:MAG: nitroreductase family protein [Bacteroidales bacterium]
MLNNIKHTIIARKSCRTFNQEYLKHSHKKALEEFIELNKKVITGDNINLTILEKGTGEQKMKLAYGAIRGNNTYLLGFTKDDPIARLNYGYLMEKVVLKATELGVASCWIGYFDHDYFNDIVLEKGSVIPGLVVIGYAAEKKTIPEKFMRYAVGASQRMLWEKLFFNYHTQVPVNRSQIDSNRDSTLYKYSESLEMLRLAPSASNTQPWRIFFDEKSDTFHFYKKPKNRIYESMGMHELDIGIAMAHFELTSLCNNLNGSWTIYSDPGKLQLPDDLQYVISWKCENQSN